MGDSGPWISGALVTGAVGADDAGESLERADDLAASPRLEILHEQQLKAPHGCALCLSRFLVRRREKRGKELFLKSRETGGSERERRRCLGTEVGVSPGNPPPPGKLLLSNFCGRCFSAL